MHQNESVYYASKRPEMLAMLPERFTTVLEIGCGAGNFSASLQDGTRVTWGVEPNPEAAGKARKQLDHVLVGLFFDVENQLPDGHFDLIVCNDVIEHMPDHDAFLERIKRKLSPQGCLVGSLPNILHFTSILKIFFLRDWQYRDQGIFDRTHLRFFTAKSLKRTLRSHAYRIERLRGINSIITQGTMYKRSTPVTDFATRIANALFIVATLGYYFDSQYFQLAFRVRKES